MKYFISPFTHWRTISTNYYDLTKYVKHFQFLWKQNSFIDLEEGFEAGFLAIQATRKGLFFRVKQMHWILLLFWFISRSCERNLERLPNPSEARNASEQRYGKTSWVFFLEGKMVKAKGQVWQNLFFSNPRIFMGATGHLMLTNIVFFRHCIFAVY